MTKERLSKLQKAILKVLYESERSMRKFEVIEKIVPIKYPNLQDEYEARQPISQYHWWVKQHTRTIGDPINKSMTNMDRKGLIEVDFNARKRAYQLTEHGRRIAAQLRNKSMAKVLSIRWTADKTHSDGKF